MIPFGSRFPGKNECAPHVGIGQAHMKKWGLMMLLNDSLWPELMRSRSELKALNRSSYSPHNTSSCLSAWKQPDCRNNLSEKVQESWGIFCKVLPASTQRGLNKTQWASFSWCWHYPPFQRVCGASSVEETFALFPQASILSEIPQEETWAPWALLHWASSNLLILSRELCTRRGKLQLYVQIDSNSEGSSHLGPCGLDI